MSLKPITVWGHWGGPNPYKVVMILEELHLPYTINNVEFQDVKKEEYTKINPNGRLPAIQDPNTGVTLWESGAIILYLVETYDKTHSISFPSSPDTFTALQWLMFEVTGQGPYTGQATWFTRFHPESLPSARERYYKEIVRVATVLDTVLSRSEGGWLVGGRCSYADVSFVTWAKVAEGLFGEIGKDDLKGLENYQGWIKRMDEREAVKKVMSMMIEGRKAHGLK